MSAALLLAAVLGSTCFIPTEQTAGWKRVDIPDDAPALAAPPDVDQFRAGESGWVLEHDPHSYKGVTEQSRGRTDYTFRVTPDTRRLQVRFLEPLRGARVDVTAYTENGIRAFPLKSDERIGGNAIELQWNLPEIDYLLIRVHHHLRPIPVVAEWQTARFVDVAQDPSMPAVFQQRRSLYFRHPGGRTLELCDRPGQPLASDRARLQGMPVTVTLRPR